MKKNKLTTLTTFAAFSAVMLGGILTTPLTHAQSNRFNERVDIVRKHSNTLSYNMAWENFGSTAEYRDLLTQYLPISNYLAASSNTLAVIVPEQNAEDIVGAASRGEIDAAYVNPVSGSKLTELGWKTVLVRSTEFRGVLLTKKNSKDSKATNPAFADLKGKAILASKNSLANQYFKNTLAQEKALDTANYVEQGRTEQDLVNILKSSNSLYGVIVSQDSVEKILRDNPGIFNSTLKSNPGPGYVLMTSTRSAVADNVLRDAFLRLTANGIDSKPTLFGLEDSVFSSDFRLFKDPTPQELSVAKELAGSLVNLKTKNSF